jgi:hypothetical protein
MAKQFCRLAMLEIGEGSQADPLAIAEQRQATFYDRLTPMPGHIYS